MISRGDRYETPHLLHITSMPTFRFMGAAGHTLYARNNVLLSMSSRTKNDRERPLRGIAGSSHHRGVTEVASGLTRHNARRCTLRRLIQERNAIHLQLFSDAAGL
jgi:hypothetical protein